MLDSSEGEQFPFPLGTKAKPPSQKVAFLFFITWQMQNIFFNQYVKLILKDILNLLCCFLKIKYNIFYVLTLYRYINKKSVVNCSRDFNDITSLTINIRKGKP